jgi:hypothetical protein
MGVGRSSRNVARFEDARPEVEDGRCDQTELHGLLCQIVLHAKVCGANGKTIYAVIHQGAVEVT